VAARGRHRRLRRGPGNGLGHGLEEASLVALFALPAAHPAIGRRARSAAAVPGLVTPTDVFNHPAALRAPGNGR
jgi:hypothetical protein